MFDAWLDTQRIGGGRVWSTEIEREIDTRITRSPS
jgi:hypothetical protein